jgi:hypothetical protein
MVSITVNEIALLAKNEGRPAIERRFRDQLPIPSPGRILLLAMKNEWSKLNSNGEVFLLNPRLQTPTVAIVWRGREEEEHMDALFQPHQGLFAVPYTWEQDFFIDAKRPNEQVAIPLGGTH